MIMSRGVTRCYHSCSIKIAVIWFLCSSIFCGFFRMALQNSSSPDKSNRPLISGSFISYAEQRSILYAKMAKDLDDNGATFLKQGETSQSLSLLDLFSMQNGTIKPILKAVVPPVRANVLKLSAEYSVPMSEAVKNVFLPDFDKVIWFQNSSMYHSSMFHASHHISPVLATESEIEAEVTAVKLVSETICPLHIALDRVVLTSTGVLLGCWQVVSGTDPVTIRDKLKIALTRAPKRQLYDVAMLHTSFARLLGPPNELPEEGSKSSGLQIFHDLVSRLNSQIRGFKAIVTELWYVEEYDLLALALNGKMKTRKFKIGCPNA